MNFDTFKRAVDSLEGYLGIINLIGGEPTLHPEFERFARYLGSKFPPRISWNELIYPQQDFIKMIHRVELEDAKYINDGVERIDVIGAGMSSNMGRSYKKHYEIISDTFSYQCLNDHMNPIYHQPGLICRKDMRIPDDEWYKLRDACWLQNEWSAGITPKGAFFCEVAGVLDMLFDGPGGWPIEPGWWKREPKDFGEQLCWCELCGFALDTFTRDSSEEIDDVSPTMYEMLKAVDSPKLKSGRVNVIKIKNGEISEESKLENKHFSAGMPYIEHYEDRFNALNSVLFCHNYDLIVIGGDGAYNSNDTQFEQKFTLAEGAGFGAALNRAVASSREWLVVRSANAEMADDYCERMEKYVLNPGTMHYLDLSRSNDTEYVKNANEETLGFAAMFSKKALSLREFGFDRIARTRTFAEIINMWQPEKVIELSTKINDVNKFHSLTKEAKYAVWGTGSAGCHAVEAIRQVGAELTCAVDRDCTKHGREFYGVSIQSPERLAADLNKFDYLIAANYTRFVEIRRDAMNMGVAKERILLMNNL
ncbi:hypothetical protein FACS189475_03930 [Betaproteobacteria bacterium]|nr:hypothetical protein FACS189475_03930 [Betaproteobacteria bacterium]